MSAQYCLPVPVFHFWSKLTHPAARSLRDSWATCLNFKPPHVYCMNEYPQNCWMRMNITRQFWHKYVYEWRCTDWRYIHVWCSSELKSFVYSLYVFFLTRVDFVCFRRSRSVLKFCILLPLSCLVSWNCQSALCRRSIRLSVFEMSFIHFASTVVAVLSSRLIHIFVNWHVSNVWFVWSAVLRMVNSWFRRATSVLICKTMSCPQAM